MDIFPTLSAMLSFTSKNTVKAISLDLVEFSQSTLYPPHCSWVSFKSEKVAPWNTNS